MRLFLLSLSFALLPVSAHAAPTASQLLQQMQRSTTPVSMQGEFHGEATNAGVQAYSSLWISGQSVPAHKEASMKMTIDVTVPQYNVSARVRGESIVAGLTPYVKLNEMTGVWDNPIMKLSLSGLMKRWVKIDMPEEFTMMEEMTAEDMAEIDSLFAITERSTPQGMEYDFVMHEPAQPAYDDWGYRVSRTRTSISGTLSVNKNGTFRKMVVHVGIGDRTGSAKGTMTVLPIAAATRITAPSDAVTLDEATSLITGKPVQPESADDWSETEWNDESWYEEETETPPQSSSLCGTRSLCGSRPSRRSIQD